MPSKNTELFVVLLAGKEEIRTGAVLLSVKPSPTIPLTPEPQANNALLPEIPVLVFEYIFPAVVKLLIEISFHLPNSYIELTLIWTGDDLVVVVASPNWPEALPPQVYKFLVVDNPTVCEEPATTLLKLSPNTKGFILTEPESVSPALVIVNWLFDSSIILLFAEPSPVINNIVFAFFTIWLGGSNDALLELVFAYNTWFFTICKLLIKPRQLV